MKTIVYRNIIRYLLPTLLLLSMSAQASELSIPNTFQPGTPAKASEVNANFIAIETAVDDNHARIMQLENAAGDNNSDISDLQDQIADLQATVSSLQDVVADLQDALGDLNAASAEQFVADLQDVMTLETDAVVFSGVNVKINNGAASTATVNGLGNLIVGYDEATMGTDKSGSHNVVVGPEHNYSSYGGLVAGYQNTISGIGATVSGGSFNTASGENSSVSGGTLNTASGLVSSVTAGVSNTASGEQSSVTGGNMNIASGLGSTVSGGAEHEAANSDDWRAGGLFEEN